MIKKSILISMAVFLGGCTFIPSYHRPSLPVPPQFPYAPSKTAPGSVSAYDIGWQDFFKDPRLKALIKLALDNNRDYRTAVLNVQQVKSQYRIVQYALLPSFEVDASGSRKHDLFGENITTLKSYRASVNTSYEVDLFGHIRSLKTQVLEQYLATEEASRAALISLVSQVAEQYLAERALDEQLELSRQTLGSVQSYYDLISKSYQLGNSSALDLRLAQAQMETVKVAIANYERQRAQARDALVLLLGQAIPSDLPAASVLAGQDIMEDLPAGLSSDLIARRPDILEAEHQLKAANANIGVVKASFFPVLTLTASDGTASTKLSKLFSPGSNIWSLGPQISLPLFNQNTNLANLDAARVGKNIQIAQYEKTVQVAFKEVSDGLVARDTFNDQIKAQGDLVAAQQERYNLAGARYHNGIDSYLTVLLAQQDLFSARVNLIQVSLDRFTNLISLYKALGGGWKEK
jgi:multidrug efflux system outer membrane protein